MKNKVCVLGAGIIGFSSAVCIQNCIPNVDVTLIADQFSPNTTSDASAGFWKPHLLNEGQEHLIRKWGIETFDYILQLSRSRLAAELGAQLLSGYQFSYQPMNPPWRHQVFGYRDVNKEEMKLGRGAKYGSFFTTLTIDVSAYLSWLLKRFQSNGGKVIKKKIQKLNELFHQYDVIVNCTGTGSAQLLSDNDMNSVRGQVLKVRAPWIKHFLVVINESEEFGSIGIIPGSKEVNIIGKGQAGDWNREINEKEKSRIWKRCLELNPSLQYAEVVTDLVGLRPKRSSIRLEIEEVHDNAKSVMVVHNYGHGGSGVTLHWGCANQTAQLVRNCLQNLSTKSLL